MSYQGHEKVQRYQRHTGWVNAVVIEVVQANQFPKLHRAEGLTPRPYESYVLLDSGSGGRTYWPFPKSVRSVPESSERESE